MLSCYGGAEGASSTFASLKTSETALCDGIRGRLRLQFLLHYLQVNLIVPKEPGLKNRSRKLANIDEDAHSNIIRPKSPSESRSRVAAGTKG